MKKKQKTKKKYYKLKIRLIGLLFVLLIIGLASRILFFKVAHGEDYERNVIEKQIRGGYLEQVVEPNRGSILDRDGHAFATSYSVYDVIFDVKLLKAAAAKKPKMQIDTYKILNDILGMSEEETNSYYENPDYVDRNYVAIKKGISKETAKLLTEKGSPYIFLEENTKRTYPNETVGADFVGFMTSTNKWGIENYYNDYLVGEEGRTYRHGSGTMFASKQGYDVITTIDLNMQQIAEDVIKMIAAEYSPLESTIIITNPFTGEVYAYAQYPLYNLNNPRDERSVFDINLNDWESKSELEQSNYFNNIWKDAIVQNTFEPGSTYKPLVVAAALEEGVISQESTFYCSGEKVITGQRIPCSNSNGHGTQTLTQVLQNSCNPAMIDIINLLGPELYYKYQKDYGIGQLTEIDLPNEFGANVLVYDLKQLTNPMNFSTTSMGQGFNVTPIQMVTSFATTINGGNLMKPYIVSRVVDKDASIILENNPTIVRKVISQDVSDEVRTMLRAVISPAGTGRHAIIEGYDLGGKTGTAQQFNREDGKLVYSLIGYLTVDSPELLVSVVINQPQIETEHPTPAYAFREVMLRLIKYKAIQPSGDSDIGDYLIHEKKSFEMPDLSKMHLSEASQILSDLGVDYDFIGTEGNRIRSHMPETGNNITKNTKVHLYIEPDLMGEELFELPDTVGLNLSYAEELLAEKGFIPISSEADYVETIGIIPEDATSFYNAIEQPPIEDTSEEYKSVNKEPIVIIQMPSAGKLLPKGTVVKLKVR